MKKVGFLQIGRNASAPYSRISVWNFDSIPAFIDKSRKLSTVHFTSAFASCIYCHKNLSHLWQPRLELIRIIQRTTIKVHFHLFCCITKLVALGAQHIRLDTQQRVSSKRYMCMQCSGKWPSVNTICYATHIFCLCANGSASFCPFYANCLMLNLMTVTSQILPHYFSVKWRATFVSNGHFCKFCVPTSGSCTQGDCAGCSVFCCSHVFVWFLWVYKECWHVVSFFVVVLEQCAPLKLAAICC